MRLFRLLAITVLLLACVVLGSACADTKGADGVGIQSIANNADGTLTIYLTNGQSYTTGDLTGPQGEKGDPGLPGAGVEWKHEWSNSTTYSQNDAVGYGGSSYISKQNNNTNHLPTDTNWWDPWVQKGDTGATGAPGSDGEDGADGQDGAPGPNMMVAMGTVSVAGTIYAGYNITSVTWNDTFDWWEVALTGIEYHWYTHVTSVTVYGTANGNATYASTTEGLLIVQIFDAAGAKTKLGFSFMILDTTP